jgi:hypothetical protein
MVSYETYRRTLADLPEGESLYFSGPYPGASLIKLLFFIKVLVPQAFPARGQCYKRFTAVIYKCLK